MHLARAGLAVLAVLASSAAAQPQEVLVVLADGGVAPEAVDAPLAPRTRILEAGPPAPPPERFDPNPAPLPPPSGPSAMLDGHPREGGFLSGPGSFTFLAHHTLMTGLGGLATQMVPRALESVRLGNWAGFSDTGARLAYLGTGLGGAAIGFTASAVWQFFHWMGEVTANTGLITSLFGGGFAGGFADLFSTDPYAVAWMTVIGNSVGAWILAIAAGGDLSPATSALVISGGLWAALYTAVLMAVLSFTGTVFKDRAAFDVMMITPALGAGAMALASLKFKPSVAQVMRANLFGLAGGALFFLVPALVLLTVTSPVPYILGGLGAIAGQTLVSLLWAEAAEPPPALGPGGNQPARNRDIPWW